MIIKLRSERRGAHVHERVFVGPDTDHLALAGVLIFDLGQWQAFGAALGLGASRMHGQDIEQPIVCKRHDYSSSSSSPHAHGRLPHAGHGGALMADLDNRSHWPRT